MASSSSAPDIGDDTVAMVNISNLTITKIIDTRTGQCGVEYRCERRVSIFEIYLARAGSWPACLSCKRDKRDHEMN